MDELGVDGWGGKGKKSDIQSSLLIIKVMNVGE